MKGLDLKRLKKVSSDDKTTIFRHGNGHEIKIAHHGLSPKMLEELNKIPLHEMSEGGSIESKKQRIDLERGVNKPTTLKGRSEAGVKHSPAYSYGGKKWDTELSKDEHRKTLSDLKAMPKPKLMADGGYSAYELAKGAPPDETQDSSPDTTPWYAPGSALAQPYGPPTPATNLPFTGPSFQQQLEQTQQGPFQSQYQDNQPQQSSAPSQQQGQPSSPSQGEQVDQDSDEEDGETPSSEDIDNTQNISAQGPDNAAPAASPPPTPQQVYNNNIQHLSSDDPAIVQDLHSGDIKPETYSDLFNKKGILGQIGMIFGLMVGGAGAGLSHQQNALLGMMNNELDRDLDAQKQNQAKSVNLVRLAQQHELNQAQQQLMGAQSQTQRAMAQQALSNADVNGSASALSKLEYMKNQYLYDKYNLIPPGPSKVAAGQVLGAIQQNSNQRIANAYHQASTVVANRYQMSPQSPANNMVDVGGLNDLQVRAKMGDPSVSPQDVQNATNEYGNMEQVETSRNNFNAAFSNLNQSVLKGAFSPRQRDAYVAQMAQDITKANPTISVEQATNQINAFVPKAGDPKGTDVVKRQQGNAFFNEAEANTPTMNRFGLRKYPDSQAAEGGSQAMKTSISKSGRPIGFKNGKWVYQ
jgi:hypothetical protein